VIDAMVARSLHPTDVAGSAMEQPPQLAWAGHTGRRGVIWSDVTEADADAVIAAQIQRFASCHGAWEWQHYSYDRPADLPRRLEAAGFVADPVETLLVAEIAELALDPNLPAGVELVPVVDQRGADALVAVHDEVFGGDHAAIGQAVLAGLATEPCPVAAVLAVVMAHLSVRDGWSFPRGVSSPASGGVARYRRGEVVGSSAHWSPTELRSPRNGATDTCRSTPRPTVGPSCNDWASSSWPRHNP
jgi:hypothetical protein